MNFKISIVLNRLSPKGNSLLEILNQFCSRVCWEFFGRLEGYNIRYCASCVPDKRFCPVARHVTVINRDHKTYPKQIKLAEVVVLGRPLSKGQFKNYEIKMISRKRSQSADPFTVSFYISNSNFELYLNGNQVNVTCQSVCVCILVCVCVCLSVCLLLSSDSSANTTPRDFKFLKGTIQDKIQCKRIQTNSFLHLHEIVEGLYFHSSLSVCVCLCVCVSGSFLVNKNSSRTD